MLQKFLFAFILIVAGACFGTNAVVLAQSDEAFPINKSTMTGANLPAGALKMREESVPAEMKDTLAKLIAAGGDQIRQGESEILLWTEGNYRKSASPQLTKKLETALQTSGWTYEIIERKDDVVFFTLFRAAPSRRALIGFFAMDNAAYVCALTEMLHADSPVAESENQSENQTETPAANTPSGDSSLFMKGGNTATLVGKWWRGEGSGSVDYTGKTQYKSGKNYTFEFFPDGTVEYSFNLDVLSIVQCRTKEDIKQRGRYSVSGDTLTINLSAGTSIGSSTCEKSNNFRKSVPAATITKKFTVKRMESMARPDNPWTLCFDGQEGDACFEKEVK